MKIEKGSLPGTILAGTLVFILMTILIAAQPQSSGYEIVGNSVLFGIDNFVQINTTPAIAECNENESCEQMFQVKSLSNSTINNGHVAFVFPYRPEDVKVYTIDWVTEEFGNETRTLKKHIQTFTSTSGPCEFGYEQNENKRFVTFNGSASAIVCYDEASDLGGGLWEIEYNAPITLPAHYENASEVTHLFNTGRIGSQWYGEVPKTLQSGEISYYAIRYIMNRSQPIDTDGRRKYEIWVWSGDLSSPGKIAKLDPWSQDRNDYIFFDNGDDGGDGVSPDDGNALSAHGWTSSDAGIVYDSDEHTWFDNSSNMSIIVNSAGIARAAARWTDQSNITIRVSFYDDLGATKVCHIRTQNDGTQSSQIGVRTSSFADNYTIFDASVGFFAGPARTKGWHNFSMHISKGGVFQEYYVDEVLSRNDTNVQPEWDGVDFETINLANCGWFDNVLVWSGRLDQQPQAAAANSAPIMNTTELESVSNTTSDPLRLYCNATDADGDNVSFDYNLWNNDTGALVSKSHYPDKINYTFKTHLVGANSNFVILFPNATSGGQTQIGSKSNNEWGCQISGTSEQTYNCTNIAPADFGYPSEIMIKNQITSQTDNALFFEANISFDSMRWQAQINKSADCSLWINSTPSLAYDNDWDTYIEEDGALCTGGGSSWLFFNWTTVPFDNESLRRNIGNITVDAGNYVLGCRANDKNNRSEWQNSTLLEIVGPSDSCTPPATNNDWTLNVTDLCNVTGLDIDLGTGKIYYTDSGTIIFNDSNLTVAGFVRNDSITTRTFFQFKSMQKLRIEPS